MLIDPSLQLSGIQCRVFDRWGDLVYETKSQPITWNGVLNGKVVAPGVYVYVVTLKYAEGVKDKVLYGDVTLVR